METELMPCPVCGGYVDVGWDSDSQGQAVECSTDMNPWHYKVASGDVSKAVEAHNTLARRAEIGRLVEEIVGSSNAPDTHLTILADAGGIEAVRTLYNFSDPVERECDEGEGIRYTVLDPEISVHKGEALSLLDALRLLAAECQIPEKP